MFDRMLCVARRLASEEVAAAMAADAKATMAKAKAKAAGKAAATAEAVAADRAAAIAEGPGDDFFWRYHGLYPGAVAQGTQDEGTAWT